jgi:6-phosphogluconolactonase
VLSDPNQETGPTPEAAAETASGADIANGTDTTNGADVANGTPPATTTPPWEPSPPHLFRYPDADALADAAAKRFLDSAKRAVAKHDQFVVVLAGGTTPQGLYRRLTEAPYRDEVPWDRTFFLFGDERCVPPDHDDSNYRMAKETLLDPLEIPDLRVLRMKGEQKPEEAARWYEVRLDDVFLLRSKKVFDLVLLGIGADGHTASLFPGTAALDETEKWVVANHVPRLDAWRLTMTIPALRRAARVMFLATGEAKARVVAEAFGDLPHDAPHPCERVVPRHGRRDVLVDHAAAALLPHGPS